MVIKVWNKDSTYNIGDIVSYANKFYESLTDDNTDIPIVIQPGITISTNAIIDELEFSVTANDSWRSIEVLN